MNVTIYTDASFNPVTKDAGWAFHATCGGETMKRLGQCPGNILQSCDAEMYAIFQAVYLSLVRWPKQITRFNIVTDCTACKRWLSPAFARKTRRCMLRQLRESTLAIIPAGAELNIKWVKSHQYGTTPEARMNNLVDGMSRRAVGL